MSEIQEALEQAYTEHESSINEPQGTKELPKEEEDERRDPGTERVAKGGDNSEGAGNAEEKGESEGEAKTDEQKTDAKTKSEDGTDTEKRQQADLKPPQSWNPQAREKWKDLPREVQEEALKRDSEVGKALTESAEARKTMQQYNSMLGQYQGMFSAQGVDPITGTNSILQTAAILQGGSPAQKAQIVAKLISDFGVDVKTLDNALVGKVTQNSPAPEYQALQSKVTQLESYIQQQRQYQQQTQQTQQKAIDSEVTQFIEKNEFAKDVRLQMADFMDVAERQGKKLSLQQAYDMSIAMRPDIQAIVNSRNSQKTNQESLQKARQANVSLPQKTTTESTPKPPETMRDALMQAWDS